MQVEEVGLAVGVARKLLAPLDLPMDSAAT
jgi:hypothetical protein